MQSKSIITFLLLIFSPLLHASAPSLSSDSDVSTAGYFQLTWTRASGNTGAFELQESRGEFARNDPATIYDGVDQSTIISGKKDGIYFYRVRERDSDAMSPWSNTVKVEVRHHELSKAFAFFIAGLVVFLATALVIIRGTRTDSAISQ